MTRPPKIGRLTYLRPGQAVPGLIVALERSGNRLFTGHISAISQEPERRHPHRRICTVRLTNGATMRDNEDCLLVGADLHQLSGGA